MPWTAFWPSAETTSTPGSGRWPPTWASLRTCRISPSPTCPADRRAGSGWPRCCWPDSTCSCSTSRPTTSTSPGSNGWSVFSVRSPAESPWSPTTGPFWTGSSTGSWRSTSTTTPAPSTPAAGASTSSAGRWPAASRPRPTRRGPRSGPGSASGSAPSGPGPKRGVKTAARKPRDHDKAQRGFFVNRTEKQAAKVRQSEQALARLGTVEKPWEGWELQLDLTPTGRSGDVVARLEGAVVQRGRFQLGPVDLELSWADRVAITGPNGGGKSTLLAALLGRLPLADGPALAGPERGRRRARPAPGPPGRRPGSAQRASPPRPGCYPSRPGPTLAKFGLGAGHVSRRPTALSPGERTRALLAALMASGTNCLVFDEPTNHLDLPAIEALEEALERFEGTLLVVSHDRWLLEIADRQPDLGGRGWPGPRRFGFESLPDRLPASHEDLYRQRRRRHDRPALWRAGGQGLGRHRGQRRASTRPRPPWAWPGPRSSRTRSWTCSWSASSGTSTCSWPSWRPRRPTGTSCGRAPRS